MTTDAGLESTLGKTVGLSNVRAHKLRWGILLLICLMYMIVFLDKGNISVVAPVLMRQFGFNKASMGFLFSAFWPTDWVRCRADGWPIALGHVWYWAGW
jgi:hypothetical protein